MAASDTPAPGRHGRAGEPADETSRRRAQESAGDAPEAERDAESGGGEDAERAAVERARDADPTAPTRQAG